MSDIPTAILPLPCYLLVERVLTHVEVDKEEARKILRASGVTRRYGSRQGPLVIVTERLASQMPELHRRLVTLGPRWLAESSAELDRERTDG